MPKPDAAEAPGGGSKKAFVAGEAGDTEAMARQDRLAVNRLKLHQIGSSTILHRLRKCP